MASAGESTRRPSPEGGLLASLKSWFPGFAPQGAREPAHQGAWARLTARLGTSLQRAAPKKLLLVVSFLPVGRESGGRMHERCYRPLVVSSREQGGNLG
jgi:hypothetical protein